MSDWKSKALELHKKGKSWRSIARKLGKSKSTVSDFLRKEIKGYVRPSEVTRLGKGNNILSGGENLNKRVKQIGRASCRERV